MHVFVLVDLVLNILYDSGESDTFRVAAAMM